MFTSVHPLLVLILPCVTSYKMVLFVPDIANSQVVFNSRVAETLAKAGHDVTMVMMSGFDERDSHYVKIKEGITVYRLNVSVGIGKKQLEAMQERTIFEDLPIWDARLRELMSTMMTVFTGMCRRTLENKEFLHWLTEQKFDLAFVFVPDGCPIGLVHYAKIPSWIWLSSAGLVDFVADAVGVPTISSYVPPIIMESTDHMNFWERTKSLIGHQLTIFFWKRTLVEPETSYFRELIDPDFPALDDIARQCPLVMLNTNELYDFPRPMLAKVVNIGGIGMQFKDAKPLQPEFQTIVDECEGLVVFSFGSITPAHKMPSKWKTAFLDAFKQFPKLTFVMRYEGLDLKDRLPPNVRQFKWLPQADLLRNPKTVAFISHGGYNSMQEAITAGVPLITAAMFGDQPRNVKLAERHHFAVNLPKGSISSETVVGALQSILNDKSFSTNIKRLSLMIKKKPVSASHLLVAWAEFVAEFKSLDNLVPAGTKLNFIQYHSLDVIALFLTIIIVIGFLLWKLLSFIVSKMVRLLSPGEKLKKS
ncbi:hypothetical protein Q1695_006865 [Nippostrongylus brasiliensis]|nr:hypothetical protein Q1695_006865 [Nippostrongylus brasiliensis]